MKKISVILLSAALMIGITSCGTVRESSGTPAADTVDVEEQNAKEDNISEEDLTDEAKTEEIIDFPETVIVDNEEVTFIIESIDADNMWGYTLKVYLENKTDKDLMFAMENASVNGYMCDPFWASTVNAGMKDNTDISFKADDFEKYHISDVTDIEFKLRVYDANDWTADNVVNEIYTIYPSGEDAYATYIREPESTDVVLYDDENCAVTITSIEPDNMWGYTINVYLENKTDQNLMYAIESSSVNGYMSNPLWATEVAAGKKEISNISWSSSDFEANGITDVENITMQFRVYDADNISTAYFVDETFEITP
ncbi:MAG: hypothetical protein J6K58_06600 [Lachnospiraceae bacterium]|nr:hypothetical protein [Lachnospiraceae bacterium]